MTTEVLLLYAIPCSCQTDLSWQKRFVKKSQRAWHSVCYGKIFAYAKQLCRALGFQLLIGHSLFWVWHNASEILNFQELRH